ncbi:MAG: DnaB-like helicase C-terminal domain-containing protein [Alistipes indistinctus]
MLSEQDADIVGFIFRPAYYNIDSWPTSQGDVSTRDLGIVNIAKQRNGATEEIPFRHNHSMTRITDYKALRQ